MATTPEAAAISTRTTATIECVALHAQERPRASAFIDSSQAISYAQFSRDIAALAGALGDLELPRGGVVAVGCTDIYTHWLLLLSLEQLNIATASFDQREAPAAYSDLLPHVDLVLSQTPMAGVPTSRQFLITPAWMRDARARAPAQSPVRERGAGDIVRVLRTSGTTGRQKRIAFTRRVYELRTQYYGERYRFSRDSRYLLSQPFSVGLPYGCATACLRAGGCVVTVPITNIGAVVEHYGITHLTLTPHFLKAFLDHLPADFSKPTGLIIGCAGSALSRQLAERALASLGTEIFDNYGCNEIGSICFRNGSPGDGFAEVWPGVDVEVVGEDGRPLPNGTPGRLKVRSDNMVEGYLNDPQTTQRFFRDGWFYPSDLAVLDGPRRLKVIGRADEMITIMGGKFAPGDLEARVMARLGQGDVGVCIVADRDGTELLHVAVAGARQGHQELLALVKECFKTMLVGGFRVVLLPAIPRNLAGKVERARLAAAVMQAVDAVSSAPSGAALRSTHPDS